MNNLRNYIFDYACQKYGDEPEYLWLKYPGYAVLRHSNNLKWYAVVMNVDKSKLGINGSGDIDILNVKCDKILISSLLGKNGYCPAYHMNKSNWISVLLDGSVPNEEIIYLIDMSNNMTKK